MKSILQDRKIIFSVSVVVLALTVVLTVLLISAPYSDNPDFSQFEAGPERKSAFFDFMLPLVQNRNEEIRELRLQVQTFYQNTDSLTRRQQRQLVKIAADYGMESFDIGVTENWDQLLSRIDIVPASLALAQAANESAWGTSNFARQGNNFYGHWCYVKGCGIVPAARESGAIHEVAVFSSVRESVHKYIANLNVHEAYQPMRSIRADLRSEGGSLTGLGLAGGLNSYSERGGEYVDDLRSIIRVNELGDLD